MGELTSSVFEKFIRNLFWHIEKKIKENLILFDLHKNMHLKNKIFRKFIRKPGNYSLCYRTSSHIGWTLEGRHSLAYVCIQCHNKWWRFRDNIISQQEYLIIRAEFLLVPFLIMLIIVCTIWKRNIQGHGHLPFVTFLWLE